MEDILAIIMIFGGMTAVGLGFSPIGRALAERIRGKAGSPGGEELRAEFGEQHELVLEEVRQVHREVAELAERVDFAERMLAQQREVPRLAPGSER
jgi:Tfp pilus assembly protein PilO